MKSKKIIQDKLTQLKIEKKLLMKELIDSGDFGITRENVDSDEAKLEGQIKILEWVLK